MDNFTEGYVKGFMRDQWINKRNSLNFYEAQELALCAARLTIKNATTMELLNLMVDDAAIPNPVIADAHGEFPNISVDARHSEGHFLKIELEDRFGEYLSSWEQ
jgi:hypothetical protein